MVLIFIFDSIFKAFKLAVLRLLGGGYGEIKDPRNELWYRTIYRGWIDEYMVCYNL